MRKNYKRTARSVTKEIVKYLETHTEDWCYIGAMAKAILGVDNKVTRMRIKNNIQYAVSLLENRGIWVMPKIDFGTRGADAYKIPTTAAADIEYIRYVICGSDRHKVS